MYNPPAPLNTIVNAIAARESRNVATKHQSVEPGRVDPCAHQDDHVSTLQSVPALQSTVYSNTAAVNRSRLTASPSGSHGEAVHIFPAALRIRTSGANSDWIREFSPPSHGLIIPSFPTAVVPSGLRQPPVSKSILIVC